MKSASLRAGAVLTLLALAACAGGSKGGVAEVARVGQPAPGWTEPTSTGGTLSMSRLRGKPVYLNFFATWCPPCNAEAPDVNAVQKRFASQGLRVVGIDELEDAAKAAQFVRKYHLVYPAVVDRGTLQSEYDVNGLPVHVFIARSGVIKKIVVGEMSKGAIVAAVQSILR